MDDGPVTPESTGSPLVKLLVIAGIVVVLAGIVAIVVRIGVGVRNTAPALEKDWKYLETVRAGDAAQVQAEKKAGATYKSNVALQLAVAAGDTTEKGVTAIISGKVTNSSNKDITRMTAPVKFNAADGSQADSREIILFDASALSARPDQPLSPGASRDVSLTLDDISTKWDKKSFEYSMGEVRITIDSTE